jgi:CheY-like chemotaxis protein
MMETPTMVNEHPDFLPNQGHERLRASALPTQEEPRTARLNGRAFGYRLVVERACVLVVDDDHDNADSLSMLLRLWGHEVLTAYGGAEGLAAATDHCPDLIVADVGMPRMTGLELARVLRRQTRMEATWLIALTGYADDEHRLLCEAAGFDAVLVKPVESSVLGQWLVRARGPRAMNRSAV